MNRSIVPRMKGVVSAAVLALSLLMPLAASAEVFSQLAIGQDGSFSGKNLTIIQKSGGTIFARATWGKAFIRMTILTDASTTVAKEYGGVASVNDIVSGDVIDVGGALSSNAESIFLTATTIRDRALISEGKTIAGSVQSPNASAQTFALTDPSLGAVTVSVSSSTDIVKGQRSIGFAELARGYKVLAGTGVYDFSTRVFAASSLTVYQDPSLFQPRNFQGSLTAMSTTSPATLTVQSGATTYSVYLSPNVSIVNKNRAASTLNRFVIGDTVRIWGALRKSDLTQVDASVVRDLNF